MILDESGGVIGYMTEDLEPVALRAKMSGVSPVQLDSNVGGCRSSAKPFDVEYSILMAPF